MMSLPDGGKRNDDSYNHFNTTPALERRTDGRTEIVHQCRAVNMLTREDFNKTTKIRVEFSEADVPMKRSKKSDDSYSERVVS